jgi:hypothetical protein
MKHRLMNPAFPDIVRQSAREETRADPCANDNRVELDSELADPFLTLIGEKEIAATRLW